MRTPIGFKVTDNKLAVIDEQEQKINSLINEIDIERLEAVLRIANEIGKRMQNQASSIAKNKSFFEFSGRHIPESLDKIYVKYYEPI